MPYDIFILSYRMIQNTYRPTSKDYNAVCQLLVDKFPKLQDEDPKYPYVSLNFAHADTTLLFCA